MVIRVYLKHIIACNCPYNFPLMINSWDSAKRLSTNGAQEFVFRKIPPENIRLSQYVKDRIFLYLFLLGRCAPLGRRTLATAGTGSGTPRRSAGSGRTHPPRRWRHPAYRRWCLSHTWDRLSRCVSDYIDVSLEYVSFVYLSFGSYRLSLGCLAL